MIAQAPATNQCSSFACRSLSLSTADKYLQPGIYVVDKRTKTGTFNLGKAESKYKYVHN